MPQQLDSYQEPCSKCLKKHPNLDSWTPCKNCPWVTPKPEPNLHQEKAQLTGKEKACMECEETLNFLEPEKDKYLCGKVKCLRSYIEKHSHNSHKKE